MTVKSEQNEKAVWLSSYIYEREWPFPVISAWTTESHCSLDQIHYIIGVFKNNNQHPNRVRSQPRL